MLKGRWGKKRYREQKILSVKNLELNTCVCVHSKHSKLKKNVLKQTKRKIASMHWYDFVY